jgi:hypothetical protein
MPIRARVGRHTRAGGRHCQNWADDQKTVIDLLNRVPVTNGGTGGSLRPRIIAGVASPELYAAIVAFETKHFPGRRLGFFEPFERMFRKLVVLGTPAPAPAPAPAPSAPPPPAPAAPTTGPVPRVLTTGEKQMLFPIFGNTIDYDQQVVGRNDRHTGGEYNSFTPGYLPNMSPHLWSWDYSLASNKEHAAVFVHEMVHVWQSGHGSNNLLRGAYLWLKYDEYEDSYKYNLDSSTRLSDFNMEQQAAIIEDYYRVSKSMAPDSNVGTRKSEADYAPYVAQLKAAGPFRWPVTGRRDKDWVGNKI